MVTATSQATPNSIATPQRSSLLSPVLRRFSLGAMADSATAVNPDEAAIRSAINRRNESIDRMSDVAAAGFCVCALLGPVTLVGWMLYGLMTELSQWNWSAMLNSVAGMSGF